MQYTSSKEGKNKSWRWERSWNPRQQIYKTKNANPGGGGFSSTKKGEKDKSQRWKKKKKKKTNLRGERKKDKSPRWEKSGTEVWAAEAVAPLISLLETLAQICGLIQILILLPALVHWVSFNTPLFIIESKRVLNTIFPSSSSSLNQRCSSSRTIFDHLMDCRWNEVRWEAKGGRCKDPMHYHCHRHHHH